MKADRWRQVDKIFHDLIEQTPQDRASFLDRNNPTLSDAPTRARKKSAITGLSFGSTVRLFHVALEALQVMANKTTTLLDPHLTPADKPVIDELAAHELVWAAAQPEYLPRSNTAERPLDVALDTDQSPTECGACG